MVQLLERFSVSRPKLIIYIILYSVVGVLMHLFGDWIHLARFVNIFQVFTCYILLLVPISLFLRGRPWHEQYIYGFFAIGGIEFWGYALGTSLAFDNNFVDELFGKRNFTLAMSFFYAWIFFLGNWSVDKIHSRLYGDSVVDQTV